MKRNPDACARREGRYDMSLPSLNPFMWIECKINLGDIAILAFGAYSAFGLIGPEKGGVAVVHEKGKRFVIGTIAIPYDMRKRAIEAEKVAFVLEPIQDDPSAIVDVLNKRGYFMRFKS